MADFSGKDRRGLAILFPQDRWDHVRDRGHFGRLAGTWQTVMTAFQSATVVLDNESEESFSDGQVRVAQERYITYVDGWKEYLIVPVIVKEDAPLSRPGTPTLPPPIRIAWSAYTAPKIPDGKVLWKWPPDDPES